MKPLKLVLLAAGGWWAWNQFNLGQYFGFGVSGSGASAVVPPATGGAIQPAPGAPAASSSGAAAAPPPSPPAASVPAAPSVVDELPPAAKSAALNFFAQHFSAAMALPLADATSEQRAALAAQRAAADLAAWLVSGDMLATTVGLAAKGSVAAAGVLDSAGIRYTADQWNYKRAEAGGSPTTADLFPANDRNYMQTATEYQAARKSAGLSGLAVVVACERRRQAGQPVMAMPLGNLAYMVRRGVA